MPAMALLFYSQVAAAAVPYNNSTAAAVLLNKTWCSYPDATMVANFTVSDDLRTPERIMVTTTVLMTVFGTALLALCLLTRLSGRHRGHSTTTRIFFRASFALFLPFMSYMFSQARTKNASPRANLILLWMLLVEILRKRVYAMVAPAGEAFTHGVGRYSFFEAIEDAAHIVWIGYLIYSYVHNTAVKSFFIILWIFSVTKLCKRAVCIELAKRSFDIARNASLISSYMAQLIRADQDQQLLIIDGAVGGGRNNNILSRCNYAVMGESKLRRKETPYGFRLPELDDILARQRESLDHHGTLAEVEAQTTKLVRVCTVWQLAESDPVFRYHRGRKRKLQDTCLSLALFKLLRRKTEGHHMAEAGTKQARTLVRQGLLEELGAERAFDVVVQELSFLDEYYQAIIPLALPKPRLFFASFTSNILFLLSYCITVTLVTGNGKIFHVLASLFRGLVDLSTDMVLQYRCFIHQASILIDMVLSSSDLIITFLLMLTLLMVESYEFVQYLLSDWYLASLLCSYARSTAPRMKTQIRKFVMAALWIKLRSHPVIKAHQFTLLRVHQLHPRQIWMLLSRLLRRRLVGLPDAVVSIEAKEAIVMVLKDILDRSDFRFSNGREALQRNTNGAFRQLEWACDESGGAATVILVWHLATALLETRNQQEHPLPPAGKAAVTLSRYCAYLLAYEPGLMPDDPAWTEKAYKDVKAELGSFFRSCFTTMHHRNRLMAAGFHLGGLTESTTMEKGVILAKELERMTGSSMVHQESVWGMLLELWAELLIFVARAPSGGPAAHTWALANGGEFITHIWAMLVHAGFDVPIPGHHDATVHCDDIPII